MAREELKTPAKINIGLYVTGKRQDVFHNIETIFYPINLFDRIVIEESDGFYFTSSDKTLLSEGENLIVRAKNLIEEYSGERLNFKIYLEKNIPIGAGLGGGSSDAAAVLNGLNEYAGLNLSEQELFDLALRLGSDVPFFLNPRPAFAEGRGEILQSIVFNIEQPIVIVNPGIHVSTAWAYSRIQPKESGFDLRKIESLDSYQFRSLISRVENDFENEVFAKYPEIKEIKLLHYRLGAFFSSMSGSGSTVFGIYPDEKSALAASGIMKEQNYFAFIHFEGKSS
jgi:4-diphosphocytidyl-2-C-methyl-D-erythritol kinase